MNIPKKYKVVITQSAKLDVKRKKQYILKKFKYREYAESFSQTMRREAMSLETFPAGYIPTGFVYRGYEIYLKPKSKHLFFYTIDEKAHVVSVIRILQDGMDWNRIIKRWIRERQG